jgi:uncharacterized Zn finger protein
MTAAVFAEPVGECERSIGMQQWCASVADLVDDTLVRRLASPSDLRSGREIAATGGVEFVKRGPLRVVARVKGGQTRTVELLSGASGLEWSCSCLGSRKHSFCKHCVAAALETRWRSPSRRIA